LEIASAVKTFFSPGTSIGSLDAASAATLIAAASDVTLILNADGTICDMAFRNEELFADLVDSASWMGRSLVSTVATDSRAKVTVLLREATTNAESRWRHINHLAADGRSVPVLYCGVQVGGDGRIVLFGRDLRAMSQLQQRLMNAQQSLERDYSRMREVETRYRLLFQLSSEAVLIVDPAKGRVVEANPAACTLFGATAEEIIGQALPGIFDGEGLANVQAHLSAVRGGSQEDAVTAHLARGQAGAQVRVRASLFRQENLTLFLMRLSAVPSDSVAALPDVKTKLLRVVESAPDGFVVTDDTGNVLTANAAFLQMAQLPNEKAAVGEPLDRWIGQSGVDLDVLVSNLRQRGSVQFFSTVLRAEDGGTVQVEISAVSVRNGGSHMSFGYAVRNVGPRVQVPTRAKRELPRSVEQLTELIGRVALKDLVREATEVIERLSIEAALELTGDNRASAAEMLGLSRQSLYVKLRRYGLGDLTTAEES
jgi:transcriptional regulator PpsR